MVLRAAPLRTLGGVWLGGEGEVEPVSWPSHPGCRSGVKGEGTLGSVAVGVEEAGVALDGGAGHGGGHGQ